MEKFILGIESSCDDTSAAVISNTKILANVTANQDIHREFGGVVPELASRAHQQNIVPVVDAALKKSGISSNQLSAIAFTSGPGLMGSLLVGTSFAKSMAMALNIPLIEVNHMQAHILAHFIENEGMETPPFPFLCLTVSGGHTQIVKVNDHFEYVLLGETIDDAAGEAFDKAAKIMGLPYPGGPLIDKYAQLGDSSKFSFNKPRMDEYNFSFSGLKTSILYYLQKEVKTNPNFVEENLNDLCASIQRTIMEILFDKLEKASADTGIKHIAIAGGVSANSALRKGLKERENILGWKPYIPSFEFCTDNGAMIAVSGYFKFLKQNFSEIDVLAQARKKLNAE
ncbi:putative glycoprotease GCP [Owenweeksia hongkongensis DSM 17368]|uniref:tRNA N6-adenosine threonylcarbamoyltransferase n=1 Tax=Owenweeksia hongkongensis (strain DSM 17368 / CIP 108786 / JCM 12287 / NRRL B-23963 / UST20020801) TaxID=926562 RepID=G8R1J6_OWEHD|nr:tRNA (adenosine(37)-N6)-threonylcarbamoyltransferase complex transferase subunit TsaD [Owenweeksia hongkongensis]AEV31735.1 putative glycoprotease GCP [Owenweeksia hongkongensis DSM 17368]